MISCYYEKMVTEQDYVKVDFSDWTKIKVFQDRYKCSEEEVLKALLMMVTLNPMLKKEFYYHLNQITQEE